MRLNALHEPEPGPHLHLATTGPYFPQLNKYHEEKTNDWGSNE